VFYDYEITVPANTLDDSPVVTELKLSAGIINWVELRFRYGPSFMVKVKIFQGGHQVWPTNQEGAFSDDGRPIAFSENFELDAGQNVLTVVCTSPGTKYDHVINLRLGILPPEVVQPFSGVSGMLNKFLNFMGVKG